VFNQSVQQYSHLFCQQIGYTCDGGSLTAPEKCVMSISGMFVYSLYIQFHFLESLRFKEVCNLISVLVYVAFRRAHPDDATMNDVKKALSDNGIDFDQLKYWNADRCRQLLVG
jgi:hypothetical protein